MATRAPREPSGPGRVEVGFRKAGAVLLIAMGAATLSACADNEVGATPPTGVETSAPANLSEQEQIEAAIAARPVEGTPEYEAFFADYSIPYVEGQPAEEVLAAFDTVIDKWITSGYSDGPQNEEELQDWLKEQHSNGTSKSVEDIADELELNYYDNGIANEVIGEGALDTPWGQQIVLTEGDNPGIATLHQNRIIGMIIGDIPKNATITTTGVDVDFNSPTEIRGTTTATIGGVDGFGGSYYLQAWDSNGDQVFDQWLYKGKAS